MVTMIERIGEAMYEREISAVRKLATDPNFIDPMRRERIIIWTRNVRAVFELMADNAEQTKWPIIWKVMIDAALKETP